jgi:Domain of unknown function (DUF6766)
MRRWVKEQSLSLFFLALFLATLVGHSFAGQHAYNAEQLAHDSEPLSWSRYVFSSHFGEAVIENWQSEWLQFMVFAMATIWFLQKGSNESKELDQAGLESDQRQRVKGYADERSPLWAKVDDFRRTMYENSFVIVMAVIFFASWFVQSLTAWNEFNDDQRQHGESTVSWLTYLDRADFWEKTLQNWQSEFLAVGTMVVFTIYLRQRGSPESKPVGAPHDETASSG